MKDEIKLRNKSRQWLKNASLWRRLPSLVFLNGVGLLFSSSARKTLGKPAVLVCAPIFPAGSPQTGLLCLPFCPGGLTLPKAELWSSSAKPCKVRKQNAGSLPAARSQIWGTASRKGWMLKMSILPWTFLQLLTWKEPMPHTLYLPDTQVIWESPGSFLRKASVNPSLVSCPISLPSTLWFYLL